MSSELHHDPIARFAKWLDDASAAQLAQPEAAALATADAQGRPSVRMVLLKSADLAGVVFYSNSQSRKGRELEANPHAALCFFWEPLGRQVRVEGEVERVEATEADRYFASRDRDSQLGAWASLQSEPLSDRDTLDVRLDEIRSRYPSGAVPRPAHWGGYRIRPEAIEFWQAGEARLHHRELYRRDGKSWQRTLLYP